MLRDTLRTRTRTRGRLSTDPACTLTMARLNTLAPDAGSVQLLVDDPERLRLVDDDLPTPPHSFVGDNSHSHRQPIPSHPCRLPCMHSPPALLQLIRGYAVLQAHLPPHIWSTTTFRPYRTPLWATYAHSHRQRSPSHRPQCPCVENPAALFLLILDMPVCRPTDHQGKSADSPLQSSSAWQGRHHYCFTPQFKMQLNNNYGLLYVQIYIYRFCFVFLYVFIYILFLHLYFHL